MKLHKSFLQVALATLLFQPLSLWSNTAGVTRPQQQSPQRSHKLMWWVVGTTAVIGIITVAVLLHRQAKNKVKHVGELMPYINTKYPLLDAQLKVLWNYRSVLIPLLEKLSKEQLEEIKYMRWLTDFLHGNIPALTSTTGDVNFFETHMFETLMLELDDVLGVNNPFRFTLSRYGSEENGPTRLESTIPKLYLPVTISASGPKQELQNFVKSFFTQQKYQLTKNAPPSHLADYFSGNLPPVLYIPLRHQDATSQQFSPNTKSVTCPLEFDFGQYHTQPTGHPTYRLRHVIMHKKGADSRSYYTNYTRLENGTWIRNNDRSASINITEIQLLETLGYTNEGVPVDLFYEKATR